MWLNLLTRGVLGIIMDYCFLGGCLHAAHPSCMRSPEIAFDPWFVRSLLHLFSWDLGVL